jgi:hypothetical protein
MTNVERVALRAIHYAVEELRARRSISAWMQVGDERLNGDQIQRLSVAEIFRR